MRRLTLIISAVFVAAGFVCLASLSVKAEPAEKSGSSDGSEGLDTTSQSTAPGDDQLGADFISQGSAAGAQSSPAVKEAREDTADEARLPDYSQVVDNSMKGRFRAPGWQEESGEGGSYGDDYVEMGPGSGTQPARFRVRIPTDNDYSVYAWWPGGSDNSDARFGVSTASGTKWTWVDQGEDDGIWIKIGTYEMDKGQRFVWVAPNPSGTVVADAVAVVRGRTAAPPEEPDAGEAAFSISSINDPTGHDVVRRARKFMGTKYRYATCTTYLMSCTCETRKTYRRFGHRLPMTEAGQWRYDDGARIVHSKSKLRPGDEVFFKENGSGGGITHVGIYSGNGNLVHASGYFGKVVESKMKYIRGYFSAKRYRLR